MIVGSLAVLGVAAYASFNLQQGETRRLLTSSTSDTTRELQIMQGAGVNGDPLIMGLSGQLFKFEGRSGAWYSAISTPSFQWNMKLQTYESCPEHSNNFLSGVGMTFFKKGSSRKRIEVSVTNPYNVGVGCGGLSLSHCLGAGSLELVIDGVKHLIGGDYKFHDGTGRVVAFNTFHQCSRKWYDFYVKSSAFHEGEFGIRSGRKLHKVELKADVFDIIGSLKETMVDSEACETWLHSRKEYHDLFKQPGHYSTVIVQTEDVSLHLEYKQETERCHAHSIDVWISSVNPDLLNQDWEGIIGETKDLSYSPMHTKHSSVNRSAVLKYVNDSDYEVNSPFSKRCKGCYGAV